MHIRFKRERQAPSLLANVYEHWQVTYVAPIIIIYTHLVILPLIRRDKLGDARYPALR